MTEKTAFSADEIAAIRKLAKLWDDAGGIDKWVMQNSRYRGYLRNLGFVGVDGDGDLLFNEYAAVEDYGSPTVDITPFCIEMSALADPQGWAAYLAELMAEEDRANATIRAEELRQREAQERAVYETLKAKFG